MAGSARLNMKAIYLNHAFSSKKSASTAMFLLISGGLMLATSVFYIQYLTNKTHRLEADIEQLAHSKNPRSSVKLNNKESIKTRDEMVAVNAAISEIVMPWTSIFKILEATDSPDIKLMTIEPNTKKQVLRINAVAMDMDSMMRYIDDLSQQKMLKSVALVTQENADINGQPALHFVVEALW
ncbi:MULTISPECIES: hypothetical protein [Methylotenera]|uniref:hypothetical protein n=1 Tax=Methylotenera TaxID=359407 RepID=UPI00039D6874|nr:MULTISPECIES: hypothetical protein [Methylotenera]